MKTLNTIENIMNQQSTIVLLMMVIISTICAGCKADEIKITEPVIVELSEYETLVSYEDNLIATPNYIQLGAQSNLYVFDAAKRSVVKLNHDGEIEQQFGREGRGPGELLWASHLQLTSDHLYIVDPRQFLIHKYLLSGEFDSSFSFGDLGYISSAAPPPPVSASVVMPSQLSNKPHITPLGNVMLSPVGTGEETDNLYHRYGWDGERLSEFGDIPEGATFVLDNYEIRDDINAGEIPAFYRANAFPVMNAQNPGQVNVVYSSLAKIASYMLDGEKIRETDVSDTPEIEMITKSFFNRMERMQRADIRFRIDLNYYHSGVAGPNGDLFLVTNPDSLWIHQFNPEGELTRGYRLKSDDENKLMPIFDIDFTDNRIYIVTELGDIRLYPF